jgi:hypothetical protein
MHWRQQQPDLPRMQPGVCAQDIDPGAIPTFDSVAADIAGRSRVTKVGEGTFKEVFKCRDMVIAVMPIEGTVEVNGEPQKATEDVLGEVLMSKHLGALDAPTSPCGAPNGAPSQRQLFCATPTQPNSSVWLAMLPPRKASRATLCGLRSRPDEQHTVLPNGAPLRGRARALPRAPAEGLARIRCRAPRHRK